MLEQAKISANSELERAKALYKDAYESGDAEAVVDAQENLTAAKIKVDSANNFKLPALQEEETPVNLQTESVQSRLMHERTSGRNNPWFNSDEEMTSLVLGLHGSKRTA